MSTVNHTSFRRVPAPQLPGTSFVCKPNEGWVTEPFVQATGVIAWQRARYAPGVNPTDASAVPLECEIGFKNGVVLHYGGVGHHLTVYRQNANGRQVLRQVSTDCPARVLPLLRDRSQGGEYGISIRVHGYCDQVISPEGDMEFRYRRPETLEWVRASILRSAVNTARVEGLAMGHGSSRMTRVSGRLITAEHVYMNDGTEIRLFVTQRHVCG
ncbi:MAG TPA: hypothetical protein VGO93_25775 [Candidatus Xenobia bacterium]